MLQTNSREVIAAFAGAVIGFAGPILLHLQLARSTDAEAFGMPIAAFCVPGLFLGSIIGVCLARRRSN